MLNTKNYCLVLGMGKTGASVATFLKNKNIPHEIVDTTSDVNQVNLQKMTHLVQSPGVSLNNVFSKYAIDNNIPILTDIDIFQGLYPLANYIGVTGTNGKSTTTALMGHILNACNIPCHVGGNIGVPVLDLPSPNEKDYIVLELSSYQLELSQPIDTNIAIWTNITPDHLERHGSIDAYISAKERLLFKAESIIMGIDDKYSKMIYEKYRSKKNIITVSRYPGADIIYDDSKIYIPKFSATFETRGYQNLQGLHNHQNAAFTIGAALMLGIDVAAIDSALKSFGGLAHRQEIVYQDLRLIIVNDSKATNADSVRQAFDVYKKHNIYWVLGGIEKSDSIYSLENYFPYVTKAYTFGQSADNFNEILKKSNVSSTKCATLKEATTQAYQSIMTSHKDKTSVLLFSPSCASFDQFKNFEERGACFKHIIQELLNGKSAFFPT
jgi:UDP-N-acetylmuramoylalanine--D-glutamate ligase